MLLIRQMGGTLPACAGYSPFYVRCKPPGAGSSSHVRIASRGSGARITSSRNLKQPVKSRPGLAATPAPPRSDKHLCADDQACGERKKGYHAPSKPFLHKRPTTTSPPASATGAVG